MLSRARKRFVAKPRLEKPSMGASDSRFPWGEWCSWLNLECRLSCSTSQPVGFEYQHSPALRSTTNLMWQLSSCSTQPHVACRTKCSVLDKSCLLQQWSRSAEWNWIKQHNYYCSTRQRRKLAHWTTRSRRPLTASTCRSWPGWWSFLGMPSSNRQPHSRSSTKWFHVATLGNLLGSEAFEIWRCCR